MADSKENQNLVMQRDLLYQENGILREKLKVSDKTIQRLQERIRVLEAENNKLKAKVKDRCNVGLGNSDDNVMIQDDTAKVDIIVVEDSEDDNDDSTDVKDDINSIRDDNEDKKSEDSRDDITDVKDDINSIRDEDKDRNSEDNCKGNEDNYKRDELDQGEEDVGRHTEKKDEEAADNTKDVMEDTEDVKEDTKDVKDDNDKEDGDTEDKDKEDSDKEDDAKDEVKDNLSGNGGVIIEEDVTQDSTDMSDPKTTFDWVCKECNKVLKYKETLKAHYSRKHPHTSFPQEYENIVIQYRCGACGTKVSDLYAHIFRGNSCSEMPVKDKKAKKILYDISKQHKYVTGLETDKDKTTEESDHSKTGSLTGPEETTIMSAKANAVSSKTVKVNFLPDYPSFLEDELTDKQRLNALQDMIEEFPTDKLDELRDTEVKTLVAKKDNIHVTDEDIKFLCRRKKWLKSSTIDVFVSRVADSYPGGPNMFFLPHTFFIRLQKCKKVAGKKDFSPVSGFTENINIFEYEHVLLPLLVNRHFVLGHIDLSSSQQVKVEVIDSAQRSGHTIPSLLTDWVVNEHEKVFGKKLLCTPEQRVINLDVQDDQHSCGCFVAGFALAIAYEKSVKNIRQSMMKEMRKLMALVLIYSTSD